MSVKVVCLRPREDFINVGVTPPESLSITYLAPGDAQLAARMAEADALLIPAVGPDLPAALFQDTGIKLVQVTGAGIDRLDADAMKALGIAVANVPGGSSAAIAEYAVSSALTMLRKTCWADRELRKGNYAAARARMVSENLAGLGGLTVGVIGLGMIGMAVAQAFHRMGSQIVYHDPAPRDAKMVDAMAARSMPLMELLACSDIVTVHVPLLPSTRSMIAEPQLEQMKAGAILVNASRGGVVDETALAAGLTSGHLAGAAVDVYSTEPPPADNPLFTLGEEAAGRLLLTPHIAGVTRQAWALLFATAWQNVEAVLLRGEPSINRVL